MTKFKKLLHKFYANPAGVHYSDIEKMLIAHGCTKISTKGSHMKFKHHLAKYDLIIPVHHHDCKDFYKKSTLKFIKNNHLDIDNENHD